MMNSCILPFEFESRLIIGKMEVVCAHLQSLQSWGVTRERERPNLKVSYGLILSTRIYKDGQNIQIETEKDKSGNPHVHSTESAADEQQF